MTYKFTTLRHPVEKLLEAEYFLDGLTFANGKEFQYELNAFLSASRSVTFLLQSAMSKIPHFACWYETQQAAMRADAAMRFFIGLRNVSQKQGPVSFVQGDSLSGGWTYRFVGRPHAVPQELIGKDIRTCCALHLSKLAHLLLICAETFLFESCPAQAFTVEGKRALGYELCDAEVAVGLPLGYTEFAGASEVEVLRILRREIEPLDVDSIKRIAAGNFQLSNAVSIFEDQSKPNLIDSFAEEMSILNEKQFNPREAFIKSVYKLIKRKNPDK